jgi:hypothetical protein
MRGDDQDTPAGFEQSMKFFNCTNDVRNVFDEVDGADLAKRRVSEWEREVVKIGDHVRIGIDVPIDSDRAWVFFDPTAYIEYPVREVGRR